MPYFREEDKKTRNNSWADEAQAVLVLAIQTIDEECYTQIQNDKTPLGNLRHRLDLILNSNQLNKKRHALKTSKQDNRRAVSSRQDA